MKAVENHITLGELQRRIKSAVEQALPMPVWVTAEIAELKVNYSGHCYMELVEKSDAPSRGRATDTGMPCAQARAVVWRSQYAMLAAYFEAETGSRLQAGMKILAKVVVTYHELYGLSLQITDLDASYTLGEVERQKQLTIKQLQADGVWDMNRQTELAPIVQRIAVISSASAAGYRDFCNELHSSGYAFSVTLFDAVVQGQAAEQSVIDALSAAAAKEDEFDAVVIIRGGGSASDLSCFNSYRLCCYVAQFPLPVITGIGHDKDTSVADMVAHTPLKTPTAVAAWLNDRMAAAEARIDDAARRLHDAAIGFTRSRQLEAERLIAEIVRESALLAARGRAYLDMQSRQLQTEAARITSGERARLDITQSLIDGYSPQHILRMGFAVVRRGGAALLTTEGLQAGQSIEVQLCEGRLQAEVREIDTK